MPGIGVLAKIASTAGPVGRPTPNLCQLVAIIEEGSADFRAAR